MRMELSPKVLAAIAGGVVLIALIFFLVMRPPGDPSPEQLGLGKPALPGGEVSDGPIPPDVSDQPSGADQPPGQSPAGG
jgi:hypothetical protein